MTSKVQAAQFRAQKFLHNTSFLLVVGLALTSVIFSLGAAIGVLPWIEVLASWGDQPLPLAGMILQLSLSGLLIGLCFFLPSNARIMRLERSHRDFASHMPPTAAASLRCRANLTMCATAFITCAAIPNWPPLSQRFLRSQPR
jgi:hypothetical protein